jgi:hypothetical protein
MGSGGARSIPPPKSTKGGWTFQGHGGHGTAQPGTPPLHPELATSTYAPLLTQLHRYLPDARAKRLWCRTCPHHATILAELGVAFLQDGVSSDAERVQALEVFGTVVRNWATDSADEELDRWLWLCRAMLVEDRPLRQRGLTLLQQLLQQDPSLPEPLVRPMSADDFEAITIALLRLLHALETSPAPNPAHQEIVNRLLAALGHGLVVKVDLDTLADVTSEIDMPMSIDALERELLWMAAGRALRIDPDIAVWLLADDARVLKVS